MHRSSLIVKCVFTLLPFSLLLFSFLGGNTETRMAGPNALSSWLPALASQVEPQILIAASIFIIGVLFQFLLPLRAPCFALIPDSRKTEE